MNKELIKETLDAIVCADVITPEIRKMALLLRDSLLTSDDSDDSSVLKTIYVNGVAYYLSDLNKMFTTDKILMIKRVREYYTTTLKQSKAIVDKYFETLEKIE